MPLSAPALTENCQNTSNRPSGCHNLNCHLFPRNACQQNEQPCAQFNVSIMGCLPLSKAGDRHFDCLFGSDEAATLLTRRFQAPHNPDTGRADLVVEYQVRCWPDVDRSVSAMYICDERKDCPLGDDELLCSWSSNSTCNLRTEFPSKNGTCTSKAKQWCNQMVDCWPDGEDERLCHVLNTRPIHHSIVYKEGYLPFNFDRFFLTVRHRM